MLPFLLLLVLPTSSEEPLPPKCNTFLGRQCDTRLQDCVFNHSSDASLQCQCYEEYVECLRSIDPKECLRGAHCKLFDNSCKAFYCKSQPIRCPVCYAESEVDRPHKEQSFLFGLVSSPPGVFGFVVLLALMGYQCCGFAKNVICHGASCTRRACPFYKSWQWLRKRWKRNVHVKKLHEQYRRVEGGKSGGSKSSRNRRDDSSSSDGMHGSDSSGDQSWESDEEGEEGGGEGERKEQNTDVEDCGSRNEHVATKKKKKRSTKNNRRLVSTQQELENYA